VESLLRLDLDALKKWRTLTTAKRGGNRQSEEAKASITDLKEFRALERGIRPRLLLGSAFRYG
jgi:hypothetical protein